jgi:ribose transport system ATP-binding protein
MVLLEAKGIKKHFGGVIALSDGSLKCDTGKITGLLGANGSGKSTMSKIICGVHSADAGEIIYNGETVRYKNPHEARQDGISMVFQNLSLIGELTVWQNIVLGAEKNKGIFLDNQSAKELSRSILDKLLPGLDINKKIYELESGEMQIVEIAKALSEDPKLLILDEPTAALEHTQVRSLFSYMREMVKSGIGIIFISHRLWEVIEICDDVVIFSNGRRVASIDFEREGRDPEKIVNYISGEKRVKYEKVRAKISDEILLSIKNLDYGEKLKNVTFGLRKGEILGIGGLAGQGQHELMLALAGNYAGIHGDAELNGKKVTLNRISDSIRNGILLVPGDKELEGLFLKLSVYKNMIFPKLGLGRQPTFTPDQKYRGECKDIIDILSIQTQSLDVPVSTLSGGNQQKVVVGKWLPMDSNVWLLDDPAKGVDIKSKEELYRYIVNQVKEKQISVILYASDNEELVEYCDRILIMYEGQIVKILEGDEINEDTIITSSLRVK